MRGLELVFVQCSRATVDEEKRNSIFVLNEITNHIRCLWIWRTEAEEGWVIIIREYSGEATNRFFQSTLAQTRGLYRSCADELVL